MFWWCFLLLMVAGMALLLLQFMAMLGLFAAWNFYVCQ
jgi:hypothetical protein